MSAPAVERANPQDIPSGWLAVCGLLVAIGVVAFAVGLRTDPATAWRAYHVNFLFYAGLSQGAVALACALVMIGARWDGPIRHIATSFAAWTPVTFVLGCISMLGGPYIFTNWWHGAPSPKEHWLTPGRVYGTDLALFFILAWLSVAFVRAAFRPALHGAAERAPRARGLFERWTRGWRGEEAEREACGKRLRVLAPVIALLFSFGYGLIGIDQAMSLTPTVASTMFPWYFAWGGFLSGVAATALMSVLWRRSPAWRSEVTPARMHDLGKMVFAFSIFWMYLFFAQYIVMWYGNLPEETQFIGLRLGSQFLQDTWHWQWPRLDQPYVKLSLTAWAGCWVIPFWVLLGQVPKRTPAILGSVGGIVLLGFWLERNAMIWPSLVPENGMSWLGPIQIGIALGFLGAFALVYLAFTRIFPTLPLPTRD